MTNKRNYNTNKRRSHYVHVCKERDTINHDIYRITPRREHNLKLAEAPITGICDFIGRIIALLLTPIIFIVLLGIAIKVMTFAAHILSSFWITHEDDVWNVINTLLGQK
jgi:hypothetical protein